MNVLLTLIWCVGGGITSLGYLGFYKPSILTHTYILVFLLIFNIFFLIGKKSRINENEKRKITIGKKQITFIMLMNILSYIFMAPILYRALKILLINGWYELRYYAYEGSTELASALSLRIYSWIVNPIFVATIIIAAVFVYLRKSNKTLLLLSVINVFIMTITFGGRFNLVRACCYFGTGIILSYYEYKKKNNNTLLYIILGISVIAILVYLTSLRSISGMNFVENAYTYFYGSIVFFDQLINNISYNELHSQLLYGSAMFGFISNPILYFFELLFLENQNITSEYLIKVITDNYLYIGSGVRFNALSSILYVFWRDARVFGIIMGAIFLSLSYKYLTKKSFNEKGIFFLSMRIYMIFVLLSSTLSYGLLTIQNSMTIIMIIIFSSVFISKRNKKEISY